MAKSNIQFLFGIKGVRVSKPLYSRLKQDIPTRICNLQTVVH